MASTSSDNFVLQGAILSHPHLFQAQPFMQNGVPQGDPFFSAVLLVDEATAAIVNQKAMETAQRHYKNGEFNHASFGWPCQPANLKEDYKNNPRTANLWMINVKAGQSYPPSVVDGNRQPIIDRGQVYAGCIVAAGVNCYTRPQPARPGEVGQGIGVGLKGIMKTGDGDSLGGDTVNPDTLFAGVQAQAPAAPAFTQPAGAPAPQQPAQNFGQPTAPAAPGMPKPPFM